jgi:transcriptional regulator with XRE-family HTH domain
MYTKIYAGSEEMTEKTTKKFWAWFERERVKRDLSYPDIAAKADARGYPLERSTLINAQRLGRNPSPLVLNAIAAGFDLSVIEVMIKAEIFDEVPLNLIEKRPSLRRVMDNAQHMDDDDLEMIILLQKALLAQKKKRGKSRAG